MGTELVPGLYERLVDEELAEILDQRPELRAVLCKIDDEDNVGRYAELVAALLAKALRQYKPAERSQVANLLINLLSSQDGLDYLRRRKLIQPPRLLTAVVPQADPRDDLPRPSSSLVGSTLLTGAASDPSLDNELRLEMLTADRVDILVSFIKLAGLRLLMPGFEDLLKRGVMVRVITTSYLGASDPKAVEWLAAQPNVSVRVSYDTRRTRLHAKAYLFHRNSGFTSAYIGSSNMSQAAMTSGLEWNLKVTRSDMASIVDRFAIEFESYWNSYEFEAWDCTAPLRFREAIERERNVGEEVGSRFFADIQPHPFQERILEALETERQQRNHWRNLVVAATGTGKTVIAALDYRRFSSRKSPRPRLLFVAHRNEILLQSRDCFRAVLKDPNFGELLSGNSSPSSYDYLFATVQSFRSRRLWEILAAGFFDFVVVNEAHHGAANSYRELLEKLRPAVLLGLTATPERMDGSSILPDFGMRFAAEIRLPEALEEKLLCPFHYFGVTDPVSLQDDRFWRSGRYNVQELENVYTGDHVQANQRLDAIFSALNRYLDSPSSIRGVGFCVSIKHACYMADAFREKGISAFALVSSCSDEERSKTVRRFRSGELRILFTVDLLSEGFDLPEIDTVLFLRPTDSLTVFLQQLGRGLRHSPEKDCLTVLDFVAQTHRKYSVSRKYAALLPKRRYRIDREVELEFPHLPPGCSILLERQAREHVVDSIRRALRNLTAYVTETIQGIMTDLGEVPSIGDFAAVTEIPVGDVLSKKTWSEWLALASGKEPPADPDIDLFRRGIAAVSDRTAPTQLDQLDVLADLAAGASATHLDESAVLGLHQLLTLKHPTDTGITEPRDFLQRIAGNPTVLSDLGEMVAWRKDVSTVRRRNVELPISCALDLHGAYSSGEIKSALHLATWEKKGSMGVGVLTAKDRKLYVHLVTFQKEEKDFAPSTLYNDYPISPTLLHWESQSTVARSHPTADNYLRFTELGYTVLFFVRLTKQSGKLTAPFVFLGPASRLVSCEGERPLRMVWELAHAMPADLYEQARRGG